MSNYSFNLPLMETAFRYCGFKTLQEFKDDSGYSARWYYNIVHNSNVLLTALLDICTKYHLDPKAFFIEPNTVIAEVKTTRVFTFAWELKDYVILPDGSTKLFMKVLDPKIPFTTRQRFLRPGNSTMRAQHLIYALNTYNLTPDQFFIPLY